MERLLKSALFWAVLMFSASACHNPEKKQSSGASVSDSSSIDKGTAPTVQSPGQPPSDTLSSDRIITPGTSIGQTFLEESPDTLIAILGKPDYEDAAMGKAWLTWFGKKRDEHNNSTELNVFLTYRDSSMTKKAVRQIRTTSSWFLLQDSLHVYASFPAIKSAFPAIKYSGEYKEAGRLFKIYDDLDQGIAFETVTAGGQTLCTAILIHVPGKPLTAVYFPIHGEQKKH